MQALRFLDTAAASHEGSREYAYVERSLRELIDQTKQSVEDMKKECEELEADERNIEIKIKKKKEEVERTEKRLKRESTGQSYLPIKKLKVPIKIPTFLY